MSYPKVDILYLSEKDMLDAGVNDVVKCTDTMEEVVKLLDDGDSVSYTHLTLPTILLV